ncbi:MAG: hypothetical protein ACO23H_13160 [Alphaproteobacteria bacterium]
MARRPYFSGNYGSALGSTANAANLIARAGEAQGQMYANLGQQIGGMIKQYGLNKEKRNKLQSTLEGQLSADPSIVQQLTMTGDEQYDKKNMKLFDKVKSGDASIADLERANGLLSGKTTQENAMLKKQNAETQQKMNELNLEMAQLLKDPKVRDAIDQYQLNKDIRDSQKKTIPSDTAVRLKTNESKLKTLPSQTDATISANRASELKSDIELADAMNRGGVVGVAKEMEKDRELNRDNIKSLMQSRKINSVAQLYQLMNIGGTAPQDLEKRFGDIASQISKVDDSQIKVRNKDGDEVMVSLKDYQSNPDEFAPLVSDRLKALQSKKDALIEEQTSAALGAKIPYTDPETGETKYTTVAEKLAYDQARLNKIQSQRQAQIEENKARLPNAFYGIPSSPVMGY